jgi:hypothetical protein
MKSRQQIIEARTKRLIALQKAGRHKVPAIAGYLGITASGYYKIRSGINDLSSEYADKLGSMFGVTPECLIYADRPIEYVDRVLPGEPPQKKGHDPSISTKKRSKPRGRLIGSLALILSAASAFAS